MIEQRVSSGQEFFKRIGRIATGNICQTLSAGKSRLYDISNNYIFPDEAIFLNGFLHTKNARTHLKSGTPHSQTQEWLLNPAFHRQKLRVWAALLENIFRS